MYLKTIPSIIQRKLSKAIWSLPGNNSVYLTFDDGPSESTRDLLSIFAQKDARASFFCTGEQVEKHPKMIEIMRSKGHYVANHGQLHLDGWKTSTSDYLKNAEAGYLATESNSFRPPYGRMTPKQWSRLSKRFRIIMWSIMPGDFKSEVSSYDCLTTILDHLKDGSIVVLHDNDRFVSKSIEILPELIDRIKEKGFRIEALPFNS